jgi:hypothetical protein
LRYTLEKRPEQDLRLSAREQRAHTEVNTHAESDIAVGLATDIKPIGICKMCGIAIGRIDHLEDHLPAKKPFTTQFRVLFDHARLARNWEDTGPLLKAGARMLLFRVSSCSTDSAQYIRLRRVAIGAIVHPYQSDIQKFSILCSPAQE